MKTNHYDKILKEAGINPSCEEMKEKMGKAISRTYDFSNEKELNNAFLDKIEIIEYEDEGIVDMSFTYLAFPILKSANAKTLQLNKELAQALLHVEIKHSNKKMITLILKNRKDLDLSYALLIACRYSNIEIAKFLIEKGADINRGPRTALMHACGFGTLKMLHFILDKDVNLGINSKLGAAALAIAFERDRMKIGSFSASLIKKGAHIYSELIHELKHFILKNDEIFSLEDRFKIDEYFASDHISEKEKEYCETLIINFLKEYSFNFNVKGEG